MGGTAINLIAYEKVNKWNGETNWASLKVEKKNPTVTVKSGKLTLYFQVSIPEAYLLWNLQQEKSQVFGNYQLFMKPTFFQGSI